MSRANRVLKVLGTLAVVGVVLPFAAVGAANVAGGYSSHVVVSGSMEPAIGVGDVVIIEHTPGEIQRGDVITYGRGDDRLPTTHRVVDVTTQNGQTVYVTKGDANEGRDPTPVQRQQVVGEVFVTVPYIGHVLTFADTTYGFVALVVVPLGLLLLNEAWTLFTAANGTAEGEPDSDESDTGDGPPDDDDGSGETITLTARELRLALVPTAVLAVFSGWITYDTRSGVAAAITTAAGVSLLFGVGIVLSSDGSTDETGPGADRPESGGNTETAPAITAPVPVDDDRLVSVESVETVAAVAEDVERCVLWDPAANEWYLPNGERIYRCQSETDLFTGDASAQASPAADGAPEDAPVDDNAPESGNGASISDDAGSVEYRVEEGPDDD